MLLKTSSHKVSFYSDFIALHHLPFCIYLHRPHIPTQTKNPVWNPGIGFYQKSLEWWFLQCPDMSGKLRQPIPISVRRIWVGGWGEEGWHTYPPRPPPTYDRFLPPYSKNSSETLMLGHNWIHLHAHKQRRWEQMHGVGWSPAQLHSSNCLGDDLLSDEAVHSSGPGCKKCASVRGWHM